MLHRVRVQPIRVRSFDTDLRCDVTRIVAYRWTCSCGERGQSVKTVRNARVLGRLHARTP